MVKDQSHEDDDGAENHDKPNRRNEGSVVPRTAAVLRGALDGESTRTNVVPVEVPTVSALFVLPIHG
jgi:hypothetical protein